MKRESRAPVIVAILLLLLPVLYVGSYAVLVTPGRQVHRQVSPNRTETIGYTYRINSWWPSNIYWPLELIDRQLRPGLWGLAEQSENHHP
ncbi:hypothetical protein [Anatilimnocola floriformis]|uniref:hypothetical protein n=1 Tax=Anatilimnocola floriformis TaxID=2948575 RepID=UPI0020C453B9|nr:hypothetical protein [Anatilimnocola floriformis]